MVFRIPSVDENGLFPDDIEARLEGMVSTPGPPGAGVPEGGAPLQMIRKTAAGNTTEWVTPTKGMVGLSRVDNTADAEKPISTVQGDALANKADLIGGKLPASQIPSTLAPASVSTATLGVGADATPAYYQARIYVPEGEKRTALRVDQLNTSSPTDAVKIVNASKSYALKIDQTSDDNDVVNISGQGQGAYTVLGLGGTNTTLSTMKVTNSAVQVGGAVIFAQGTHPERTSSVFTAENWGKGASYSARAMSGNNNTAFRALYDTGFNHDARAVWIDANHSGGSIMYVNNATAQTSGRMVHLIQANAGSSAPIVAIENSGTGDHITANNFAVTQSGQVKASALLNFGSFNNSRIQLAAAGTSIDRNVSDANATLRVNNLNTSSTGDVAQFQKASEIRARITAAGHFAVRANTAPLDGDLVTGEAAFWFDSTNGASKLMIKAKQADGTIKSGSVNLA